MTILIAKPSALNFPLVTTLNIVNHHSSIASILNSPSTLNSSRRRRRFQLQASSLVLPLLPFPADQVLVPSEIKTLHLYEARYIALLEESLRQKNKLFVHFVLDPVGLSGTSVEASFAAKHGCLVIIEKVERLEIGALVLIRGVGRVKVLEFKQIIEFIMVRSKVKYELISNERTRRETFKNRRMSLFKKLNELKTLCNVETCVVISNGDEAEPETWPSPPEASQIVQRFMNLPTSTRIPRILDQTGFLRQCLSKISRNLDKEDMKVESLERELRLAKCLTKEEENISNSNDLHEMLHLLERKIGMIDHKIAKTETSSSRGAVEKERNDERDHGKGKQPL